MCDGSRRGPAATLIVMSKEEYLAALRPILERATGVASAQLRSLRDAAKEADVALTIGVFVGQDGEGPFDVYAQFEGADVFALNQQFQKERHLFGVTWTEDGWEPQVPARPRGWSRDELEDVVVDEVDRWVRSLAPNDPALEVLAYY